MRKWFLFGGAVVLVLFGASYLAALTIIAPKLVNGARQRAEDYLSKRFDSTVQISAFHLRIFPTIRVEADGIVLRHEGRTDVPPLIQIRKLSFGANFEGLLGRKVDIRSIRLDGLRVNTPPRQAGDPPLFKGSNQSLSEKYPVIIHEIVAEDATLVMLRKSRRSSTPPTEFQIHALRLHDFSFDRPASFQALLRNPKPAGLIQCGGQFGPWRADDPSETPVEGAYVFQNADMSTLKGLRGTMQSKGQFYGPLDYLNVDGETDIPDFALRTSAHPMALHTDFSAIVDGTNGNTILKTVTARFLRTTLSVHGEVVHLKKHMKGRTIELYTTSNSARIEDLLALAVDASPPALTGPVHLAARIDIPEGNTDLLDRMKLAGRFGVGELQFTNPKTQEKVDSLSRRGQGKPKDGEIAGALSRMQAAFNMDESTIHVSDLVFATDGAKVDLAGTYQMDSGQLEFKGRLRLDAKLSQTMTGVGAFFLKAVDPFFSKHGAGTELPIKITGTKDHPHYGLDFRDKSNKVTRGAE